MSLSGKHDKADDLVQDTLMKAWAKQDSFEMGTNIKAWLFTILRNEFYSQMRKRGREVQDTDGAFTERLSVHPSQYGLMDLADFKKALELAAGRPARSGHPHRRLGVLVRGGRGDLLVRGRHHEEPCEPGADAAPGPVAGFGRGGLRA